MLHISNLSKSFGDNLILDRVSFVLNRGERLGLVGPNGSGKTTLLKIIQGEMEPDSGGARLSPAGVRVGYLAQALESAPGGTVDGALKSAFAALAGSERRLEALLQDMSAADGDRLASLLDAYAQELDAFERQGGYDFQARADAVLRGLGLQGLDGAAPVAHLSGGQKTRLGLARLLLSEPDLLLLDEPTNHLDFEALEWLEGFITKFSGAALIVSHDRAFIDRTVSAILELDPLTHTLTRYEGSYTDYVKVKEREREKQVAAYQDQQDFIARLEGTLADKKNYARSIEQGTIDFAPRKIAKGIARRAIVQQRRIQRLLDSEERLDKPERAWQMKLEFGNTPPSGREVLQLEDVSMGFGERVLFRETNLTLRAGERLALVGVNGSGKTTLARLIAGELAPTTGRVRLGAGVRLGYYAQEQDRLDPAATSYEVIRAAAPLNPTDTRSFLHYFLFSGDDVFTPTGDLSFGERARLILAQLVAQGCNFLVLDEPINHLDLPSRGRFEQALHAFTGALLVITHDRYFIDRFASGLWGISGGSVRRYADRADFAATSARLAGGTDPASLVT